MQGEPACWDALSKAPGHSHHLGGSLLLARPQTPPLEQHSFALFQGPGQAAMGRQGVDLTPSLPSTAAGAPSCRVGT